MIGLFISLFSQSLLVLCYSKYEEFFKVLLISLLKILALTDWAFSTSKDIEVDVDRYKNIHKYMDTRVNIKYMDNINASI